MAGRVVVVTGAGAGIGRAVARRFARDGDHVALLARDEARLEDAAAEVRAEGVRALPISVDVADAGAVEAAAARIEQELGEIDVWVNDAMAAVLAKVWETDPEDFRRVMDVTFMGYLHGTQAALRRFRPRDRGVIVQVGSALSYRAIPLQASYCAAKFAIRAMSDSLRCELIDEGSNVKVVMAQLPGLNTTQFDWVRTTLRRKPRPVAPVYQPEVAAEGIFAAAAPPYRRELWIGESTVAVILGNKLLPGLADRYLGRTNVKAQQRDEPIEPDRQDYLYEPVPGHSTAHGAFDDEAKTRSPQLTVSLALRRLIARLTASDAR